MENRRTSVDQFAASSPDKERNASHEEAASGITIVPGLFVSRIFLFLVRCRTLVRPVSIAIVWRTARPWVRGRCTLLRVMTPRRLCGRWIAEVVEYGPQQPQRSTVRRSSSNSLM